MLFRSVSAHGGLEFGHGLCSSYADSLRGILCENRKFNFRRHFISVIKNDVPPSNTHALILSIADPTEISPRKSGNPKNPLSLREIPFTGLRQTRRGLAFCTVLSESCESRKRLQSKSCCTPSHHLGYV